MDSRTGRSARSPFDRDTMTTPFMKNFAFPLTSLYELNIGTKKLDLLFKPAGFKSSVPNANGLNITFESNFSDKKNVSSDEYELESDSNFVYFINNILDMFSEAYEGNISEQEYILQMITAIHTPISYFFPQYIVDDIMRLQDEDDDSEFHELLNVSNSILSTYYQKDIIKNEDANDEFESPIACIFSLLLTVNNRYFVLNFNFNRAVAFMKGGRIEITSDLDYSEYLLNNEGLTHHIINSKCETPANSPIILNRVCVQYSSVFNKNDLACYNLLNLLNNISIEAIEFPHEFHRLMKPLKIFTVTDVCPHLSGVVRPVSKETVAEYLANLGQNDLISDDYIIDAVMDFGDPQTDELLALVTSDFVIDKEDNGEEFLQLPIAEYVSSLTEKGFNLTTKEPSTLKTMVQHHYDALSNIVGDIRNLEHRDFMDASLIEGASLLNGTSVDVDLPHALISRLHEIPIWYFLIAMPVALHIWYNENVEDFLNEDRPLFNEAIFVEAVDHLKHIMVKNWN